MPTGLTPVDFAVIALYFTAAIGLGLYLSKLVAEAHGGNLFLRDDYADGAGLVVRIPA